MQPTLSLITFSFVSPDRNFLTPALRSIQLTFRFEYRQFESPKKQAKSIDSKSPIAILKDVMQLTIEGRKAAANYIRKILLEYTK
ncbi:hypothetical protein HN873_067897 [Arachis hypogaea]